MSNVLRMLVFALTFQVASHVLVALETEELIARLNDSASAETAEADDLPEKTDQATTWGPQSRTIRYEYRLLNPTAEPATELDVYVPLPLESPRQQIHYVHLPEGRPHQVVTDRHGQRLVHYTVERLEAGQWIDLGYVVGITLQNMQWQTPNEAPGDSKRELTPEARELYLRPETNYSMASDLMRCTAASLTAGATTEYEKLVRLHDHIIGSIRYVRDDDWDPAETVLARGTGSCSEYNYVLSGLCRLAGLPTRCVGGSTNGFRDLPTTDTVYHRWTEVFLSGYGWFPVDCSRDANPIRGQRSHFGRVYTDAVVWCHQAGGEDDSLGWDYRAKAHVRGQNPGIYESHRTRWFPFYPQPAIHAAYAWFLDGAGRRPAADLLECALLRWENAPQENRLQMLAALAAASRNECLRRAATLPDADQLRATQVRALCASSELAETILEKSRNLRDFRNWFRSREARLVPIADGRFQLAPAATKPETATSTAASAAIWQDLVADVVPGWEDAWKPSRDKAVVVLPLTDQTAAGLGERRDAIQAALQQRLAANAAIRLLDADRFDRWMDEQGPGSGEYWILANGGSPRQTPPELTPDLVLMPVCITTEERESVLFHLELKTLEMSSLKYVQTVAQVRRQAERQRPGDQGVLVAAGDTILARWQHDLVGRHGYDWPLAGIQAALAGADAALCNLECCVSLRGWPADKGERCSFYYRARPEMLRCLTRAGIDLVTAANNHGGDYGPPSVADTADWCEQAGLVCVGIGENLAQAETPRLVRIGPVRVAIAGLDLTMPHAAATAERPGTNYAAVQDDLRAFTDKVKRLGQWADGRCELLVLTIHWGRNWDRETPAVHRAMARIAWAHGVDLILGHSAHRLQGVEVVEGKAVVYDMGNLFFDCELQPEGRQTALFRLYLSAAGVQRIEVLPALALEGHTILADADEARRCLAEMRELCAPFGTGLLIEEDLAGRPIGVIPIAEPRVTARGEPDPQLVYAGLPARGEEIPGTVDESFLRERIPRDVQPLTPPAELAPGVRLVACQLPETATEGGLLELATWWQITAPVKANVMPAFHLRPEGDTPRRGTPWYTRHDAADWTVPLSRMTPESIVEDRYPARLAGLPPGPYKVYALAIDTARPEPDRILAEPRLLGEVEILPRDEAKP